MLYLLEVINIMKELNNLKSVYYENKKQNRSHIIGTLFR